MKRQSDIDNFGIRFLRFKNEEIFGNIEKVIMMLETLIEATPLMNASFIFTSIIYTYPEPSTTQCREM